MIPISVPVVLYVSSWFDVRNSNTASVARRVLTRYATHPGCWELRLEAKVPRTSVNRAGLKTALETVG